MINQQADSKKVVRPLTQHSFEVKLQSAFANLRAQQLLRHRERLEKAQQQKTQTLRIPMDFQKHAAFDQDQIVKIFESGRASSLLNVETLNTLKDTHLDQLKSVETPSDPARSSKTRGTRIDNL